MFMNKKTSIILLFFVFFPISGFSDCKVEKRSIQELLYDDKKELISSYCSNHASYLIGYSSMMGLMRLGDNYSTSFKEAEKSYQNCSAENDLIQKILKKDHDGHEMNLKRDCSTYIDLYEQIEKRAKG